MPIFKKILFFTLRAGISIFLLIFLFNRVNFESILCSIRNANINYLAAALGMAILNSTLCLLRWNMLLGDFKVKAGFKRVLVAFSSGMFMNLFLPSTVGIDVARSIDLSMHTKKPRQVLAAVLLDRLSGYTGVILLSIFILLFAPRQAISGDLIIIFTLVTALLVFILLMLFNKFIYSKINHWLCNLRAGKILESLSKLHEEVHLFRHNKKAIAKSLVLSIFIQVTTPVTFYLTALSLGISPDFIYFLVFVPLIGVISLMPFTIGGLGLRDAATVLLFGKIGMLKETALSVSLLNFFYLVVIGLIGGIIYVFGVSYRRIQSPEP